MPQPETLPDQPKQWTTRAKLLVSVFVLGHLAAVFAAPCAAPPPASYVANWLAGRVDGKDGVLTPYLRSLYLNHGYRFFAPNPGASHLVRYEVERREGGVVQGKFPDPEEHWPRLLYHRMFMLSETMAALSEPISEAPSAVRPFPPLLRMEPDSQWPALEQTEFLNQRAAALELAQSIANRLMDEYDGNRVRLFVQTHQLALPADLAAGRKLDDPQFLTERLLGEFTEQTP